MRKFTILLIVSALLVLTKKAEARNLWEGNQGPKFTITSGSLHVNGSKFGQPWKINPFLTAVGGKYVTKHLFHKVYTFDDLGIHVYEYPKREEANEIQVSFIRQNLKFAPKTNFNGVFKIEKTPITRKTSIQKVIKSLPVYNFTKGLKGNFYRGEYKGVYVYLNYSDNSFKFLDFISFGMSGKVK